MMQLALILPLLVPFALGNVSDLPENVDYEIVVPSDPEIMNTHLLPVREARVGDQLVIGSAITNNDNSRDWSATAITEIRDPTGITVWLNWQSAIVQSGDTMKVRTSWVPEYAGGYEVRTIVFGGMESHHVLSFTIGITKVAIVD